MVFIEIGEHRRYQIYLYILEWRCLWIDGARSVSNESSTMARAKNIVRNCRKIEKVMHVTIFDPMNCSATVDSFIILLRLTININHWFMNVHDDNLIDLIKSIDWPWVITDRLQWHRRGYNNWIVFEKSFQKDSRKKRERENEGKMLNILDRSKYRFFICMCDNYCFFWAQLINLSYLCDQIETVLNGTWCYLLEMAFVRHENWLNSITTQLQHCWNGISMANYDNNDNKSYDSRWLLLVVDVFFNMSHKSHMEDLHFLSEMLVCIVYYIL